MSDNGNSAENATGVYLGIFTSEFLAKKDSAQAFFIDPLFTDGPSLSQSSARAPPAL
jgi:hypothetical protein